MNDKQQSIICSPYYDAVYSLIFTFVWDYFPIGSILIFHRRNFALAREMGGDGKPRSISVDTQLTTEEKIKQSVMQSFQSMIYSTEKRSNTPSLNVDDAATVSRPFNSVDYNGTEKLYGALSSNLSGLGRLTGQFEVY